MQANNIGFTIPETLYQSENEVWKNLSKVDLSKIDLSRYNATDFTKELYRNWLNKLLGGRNRNGLHPLDFPLIRFFLNHQDLNTQANLFLLEHPTYIEKIYKRYGDVLGNKFYCEISPFSPQFLNDLCALEAEWECAKFIEKQIEPEKIGDFHTKVSNNTNALDISFKWKGKQWYADAKNMLHEDGNLVFIEHVLAGILWLRISGNELRKWNSIKLEGVEIDHSFRNKSVQLIRKNLDKILIEPTNEQQQETITIDDFRIVKCKRSDDQLKINLKPIEDQQKRLTITLNKIPVSQTNNRYLFSPPVAYSCNASLNQEFWRKLEGKIEELKDKITTHSINKDNFLGFINLELHAKHSNFFKNENVPQKWEGQIKEQIDKEDYPIVLHTRAFHYSDDSHRKERNVFISNKSAFKAGLKFESNKPRSTN